MSAQLRAGVAALELPLPLGAEMMGYAARTGGAEAVHDPLFARALYAAAGGEVLIVELDLCLIAPSQAAALRARIAERTGIAPGAVQVGCIHTHAGPDTGLAALLAGEAPPGHVAALFDVALEAAARAHASAAPARLGIAQGEARIGRNRRREGGPLDPDVLVLRFDRADGAPLAVLFAHGCHPTVLGHENLAYSADWPGAAIRRVEAALPGATALFALSAHADVDPRTRGLLDVAVEGKSLGAGFEAMQALGHEVGEAAARAAAGVRSSADVRIGAASTRLRVETHGGELDEEAYRRWLAARRGEALAALGLPPDAAVRTRELFALAHERCRGLPLEEARERIARVRLYLRDASAARFAGGRAPEVEVQLLRLGAARLLGFPLEPTVEVGLDWKARAGTPHAALLSIANGWLRYLPHRRNFEEPFGHQHYEVLSSTLVADASDRLLAAAGALDAGG